MSGSLFSIQLQHGRYRAGIDDIQETRNRRESVRLLTLSHVFSPVHANQPRASSASHKLLSTTVWARFSHELVYDVWCGIVGGSGIGYMDSGAIMSEVSSWFGINEGGERR